MVLKRKPLVVFTFLYLSSHFYCLRASRTAGEHKKTSPITGEPATHSCFGVYSVQMFMADWEEKLGAILWSSRCSPISYWFIFCILAPADYFVVCWVSVETGDTSRYVMPVSYTHLDVYKRQDSNMPALSALQKAVAKTCESIYGCKYFIKEQILRTLKYRNPLSCQSTPIGGRVNSSPVFLEWFVSEQNVCPVICTTILMQIILHLANGISF